MAGVLKVEHAGGVTRLTLNRADKGNALNAELVEELLGALQDAEVNGTYLVTLQGNGSKFCSGFDFSDFNEQSHGDLTLRFLRVETLLQTLYHAPYQTAVFAHGKNFGAGADLVAVCGARVATPDATFQMPGLRFGVALGTRRLAQRVGCEAARRILAETRTFGGEEARQIDFLTNLAERPEWPGLVDDFTKAASKLSVKGMTLLHRLTVADTRAADMTDLALSVSHPGLKDRIRAYREQTQKAASGRA